MSDDSRVRIVGKDGKIRYGRLVVLQVMGEMVDGKIHMVAGKDQDVFHIEDGDQFFTAIFEVDPFGRPSR